MSTPLPGQIRCPTCHRSTPPAAFCTQCGTAIPASARARPRGLDREELQDRIRVHRPGDAAFRRGSPIGEASGAVPSPYEPFRPEPEDELVLSGAEAAEDAPHVDNTPPGFDERPVPPPPVVPASVVAPGAPAAPPPARIFKEPPPPVARAAPAAVVAAASVAAAPVDAAPPPPPAPPPVVLAPAGQFEPPEQPYSPAETYDYRNPPPDDDWDRRGSGISPLAIGGFVVLGILAIAVGAFMSGLFSGGVALESPSGTPLISSAPSQAASLEPTPAASLPPTTPNPSAGGGPVVFPDGFTARTEPCAQEPSSQEGCNSSGATISGGSVWVWVGWRNGNNADTIGATIVDAAGTTVADGHIPLSSIGENGCGSSCNGWARFKFSGLAIGNYTIRVDRNGTLAAEASFTVTG
jgi:hypothetical protein